MIKMGWRKTNYERKIEMIEEIGRRRMEKLLVHHNNFNPAMNNPEVLNAQSQIMNNGKLSVFN